MAYKAVQPEGAWVAQLVEHLTLDLGSGHDLRDVRSSLSGSAFSGVHLRFSLALCPPPPRHKINIKKLVLAWLIFFSPFTFILYISLYLQVGFLVENMWMDLILNPL